MTQLQPTPPTASSPAPTRTEQFADQFARRLFATGAYTPGNALMVQALNADSLEDAMAVGEVLSARDYPDQRIRFNRVLFTDSDPELNARVPFYAILDVVLDDNSGTVQRMACGAEQPLGVFVRAAEQGWFPFEGQFELVKLDAAKTAINLVPVPARVQNLAG